MHIAKTVDEMKKLRKEIPSNKKVGFVPTMGYLHEGHLSLLRKAREENDIVILSIFVNPIQFGPNEDLDRYPRDFERDEKLAKEVGTDIIFYPTPEEMYPENYSSYVVTEGLDKHLCGAKRPGHFKGVMTVVLKLFNITKPDNTYFGQKDIQQARIIEQMIKDFNLDIKMHICPIVREEDGLAMSSRNVYLSPEERKQAIALYKGIKKGEELFKQGERDAKTIKKEVEKVVKSFNLAKIDYVEIVDYTTMSPIDKLGKKSVLALAVYFGKTRLIDNTILE
ncbi:pantoate--beta-alanine ligase [Thermotomaculum hydrothermale]|uniref:Pantothenate synthetase n=1 Tax=Thermotomaculum hydrothermale TaxID=981385 RepID=A0A7R6PLX3_9BACT|nr:pantoate--beta-alanine ligase [Thermotomaculum hydrothermale]BBB31973.1 pantoate--beta-alanine ligase [Thermotomaculum hydrothermale]